MDGRSTYGTKRVVALMLDGLRRDFITADNTPNLMAFKARGTWCGRHRSVFPSVTRVVSSSFATGCWPSEHGLAGNTVALIDDDKLKLYDVGKPEFLGHKKRLTGHVLRRPTLAERLTGDGGVIVFNNVSPGAAYMHDPLGHGHVYHRAGSYGLGRTPINGRDALDVGADIAGDRAVLDRFITEVINIRRPAVALAWLAHPDTTQHEVPLGSPRHLEILRIADEHAGLVIAAVDAARAAGEEILLLIGSDHGHQTVTKVIDVAGELVAAGLKNSDDSCDVVVAPNGTAVLIYVDPRHEERIVALRQFLEVQPWVGRVMGREDFATFGIPSGGWLTFAIAMAADDDAVNAFGAPGTSFAAKPVEGKADRLGCGQHGGLGRYEQSPFMIVEGPGLQSGRELVGDTSAIDVAPTILTFLGRSVEGLNGRALQNQQ